MISSFPFKVNHAVIYTIAVLFLVIPFNAYALFESYSGDVVGDDKPVNLSNCGAGYCYIGLGYGNDDVIVPTVRYYVGTPHSTDINYSWVIREYEDETLATTTGTSWTLNAMAYSTLADDYAFATTSDFVTFDSNYYYRLEMGGLSLTGTFGNDLSNNIYYHLYSVGSVLPDFIDGASFARLKDPVPDSTISTSTGNETLTFEYRVATWDNIINSLHNQRIKVAVRHSLSTNVYQYTLLTRQDDVVTDISFDTQYNEFSATGTVYIGMEFVQEIPTLNNQIPLNIQPIRIYEVCNATCTDSTELATFNAENNVRMFDDEVILIDEDNISVNQVGSYIASFVGNLLYLPPYGYVVIFFDTLINATATDIATMSLNVPTTSPLYGHTFDLDIDGGFTNAWTKIDSYGVTTTQGTMTETFMYWWEMFIYILFTLWIVKEIVSLNFVVGSHAPLNRGGKAEFNSNKE